MFVDLLNVAEHRFLGIYSPHVLGFQKSRLWTIYLGDFKHAKQFIFWPLYYAVFGKRKNPSFRPTLDHFAASKRRHFYKN